MTTKTKKPRSPRKPRAKRVSMRVETIRLKPPEFDGSQAMIPGVPAPKREPAQDGDDLVTVQTLRVTRREVRRWTAAAQQGAPSYMRAHAMVWARKVLNDAAAKALGSL